MIDSDQPAAPPPRPLRWLGRALAEIASFLGDAAFALVIFLLVFS